MIAPLGNLHDVVAEICYTQPIGETTMDPTANTPPTLAEESGVTLADAMKAIALQNEETAKLRAMIASQQSTISQLQAVNTVRKPGTVPIESRICNNCGTTVEEGKRCKNHPRERINEIGTGMLHNVVQPIIVRQV
jgi:uncharacterized protein (DUF885 family)